MEEKTLSLPMTSIWNNMGENTLSLPMTSLANQHAPIAARLGIQSELSDIFKEVSREEDLRKQTPLQMTDISVLNRASGATSSAPQAFLRH